MNFKGESAVSLQLSTEAFYRDFPSRAVPADVHGILLRVASLEDTLRGKIKAWSEPARRQSKRLRDLADIARLVEANSRLWASLPDVLQQEVRRRRWTRLEHPCCRVVSVSSLARWPAADRR